MSGRGAIAGIVIVCLIAGAIGVRFVGSPADSPTPGQPSSPVMATSADTFRAGFLPLLEQAAANAQALVAMGESRERNLLRIRAAQEAMSSSLAAADAWLADQQPPAPVEPAIAAYRPGAAAIRTAMSEAEAGFLRLDFDRVVRATVTLRQGAADLARAVGLLQEYVSVGLNAPAWLPPALGTGQERGWSFANHQDQRLPAPDRSRD